MPVFRGSRYEDSEFTGLMTKDLKVKKYLHIRIPLTEEDVAAGYIIHDFQQGETLDGIAFKYSKKANLWWMIAEVNNIVDPYSIEPGIQLIVPVKEMLEHRD